MYVLHDTAFLLLSSGSGLSVYMYMLHDTAFLLLSSGSGLSDTAFLLLSSGCGLSVCTCCMVLPFSRSPVGVVSVYMCAGFSFNTKRTMFHVYTLMVQSIIVV